MPELPEVEAWRRALDPEVERSPVAQAGPAHIATLKTFDPPLAALDGRAVRGRRAGGPSGCSSRPTDGELVADGAPDERRPDPLPRARASKGPKTPGLPPALRRRRRARAHRGRASGSAPASGCCGRTRSRPSSRTSAPRPTSSTPRRSRRSSPPTRAGSTRCCATSGLIAGIGRAWANEILHTAAALALRALDPALRRGDRAARDRDPRRARPRARAPAAGRRRTRRPTASTTGSASRAGAAARRSPASTSRSTRSTTAPSARPTAACSRTGGSRGCCDEDRAGRTRRPRSSSRRPPPAPAAQRGAHAADARASSPRPSPARRCSSPATSDDGAILGTLTLVIYRVSSGLKARIEDVIVDALGARPGRRRGARPRGDGARERGAAC